MPYYNMKQWLDSLYGIKEKKPLPILSFPCVSLLDVTVRELIMNSELQAKGMKMIADSVDAAASVSFMDLSVEAECFGAKVVVSDDEVPTIKECVICNATEAEALQISPIGCGRTGIYVDAISKASKLITDRPVLAGMIGPFSLAARLLDVSDIMIYCYDEPDMVHTVLKKAITFLIDYAKAFKGVGANGIVVAEPVAGLLSPTLEEEFSSPYIKQIVEAVQDDEFLVFYHNCGDKTPNMLSSILSTGCAAYHFGNAVDIQRDIIGKVPEKTIVMGNIDPVGVLCRGTTEQVRKETAELMKKCALYPNFVLSSGCDIPPNTPWQNVKAFFDASKEFYKK